MHSSFRTGTGTDRFRCAIGFRTVRRMSRRLTRRRALLCAATLALVLTSCGDDEEPEAAEDDTEEVADDSDAGVAACEEAATFTVDNTVDEMQEVAGGAPDDVKAALQAVIDGSVEQDVEAILEAQKQVEEVCEGEYGVEIPTLDDAAGE